MSKSIIDAERELKDESILKMIQHKNFSLTKFCRDHNLFAEHDHLQDEAVLYLEKQTIQDIRILDRKYNGMTCFSSRETALEHREQNPPTQEEYLHHNGMI